MASLDCAHLDFHFVRGEHALIRLGTECSSEHVVFIHEISFHGDKQETGTANLLVTKYSKFGSVCPIPGQLAGDNEGMAANSQELLLHFEKFDKMGMQDDAEVIQLDDVVYATDVTTGSHASFGGVDHVFRRPSGR